MRRIALGLMLAGAFASSAVALPTAYTYQTLDDPSAIASGATVAYGINDAGQVTGWFSDGSNVVHAFVYSGGAWTTIDNNPLNGGGGETEGFGINNSGRITGAIFDPLGHNALYDGTSWTLLGNDPNDTSNSTDYTGINNSGLMSGIYDSATGTQAFLYDGSTYATLNNPYDEVTLTVAWGLNNTGEVAGYYRGVLPTPLGNFISQHGFIFDGATFMGFDAPGADRTQAWDINDAGIVVGTYIDALSQHHWFLYDGTTFSDLDLPYDPATVLITGINDADQLVGRYAGANGEHGFIATPKSVPEPSTFTMFAMALALLGWRARTTQHRSVI
ncbi:MAG TPA: PEP-CTERM sorting domain-containing protein [Casimicrobiaceae bacterium]